MAIDKNKKKAFYIAFLFFIPFICLAGCAEFNPFEAPAEVLRHPLGTEPINIGMTKDEVIAKWGKPDQINQLEATDEWKTPREEWVYVGRYSKVPLDRSYLFKTKYLVFDGSNLVYFGDESQYKGAESKEKKR